MVRLSSTLVLLLPFLLLAILSETVSAIKFITCVSDCINTIEESISRRPFPESSANGNQPLLTKELPSSGESSTPRSTGSAYPLASLDRLDRSSSGHSNIYSNPDTPRPYTRSFAAGGQLRPSSRRIGGTVSDPTQLSRSNSLHSSIEQHGRNVYDQVRRTFERGRSLDAPYTPRLPDARPPLPPGPAIEPHLQIPSFFRTDAGNDAFAIASSPRRSTVGRTAPRGSFAGNRAPMQPQAKSMPMATFLELLQGRVRAGSHVSVRQNPSTEQNELVITRSMRDAQDGGRPDLLLRMHYGLSDPSDSSPHKLLELEAGQGDVSQLVPLQYDSKADREKGIAEMLLKELSKAMTSMAAPRNRVPMEDVDRTGRMSRKFMPTPDRNDAVGAGPRRMVRSTT